MGIKLSRSEFIDSQCCQCFWWLNGARNRGAFNSHPIAASLIVAGITSLHYLASRGVDSSGLASG